MNNLFRFLLESQILFSKEIQDLFLKGLSATEPLSVFFHSIPIYKRYFWLNFVITD